jgi:hypothetical protein
MQQIKNESASNYERRHGGSNMRHLQLSFIGVLTCISVVLFFSACAKDDVAAVDVEKQAFEDLREDIREAIADSAREAEAIRLVGVLEQDLADLRATVTARKNRAKELNSNYDISRAEFESFLAEVEAEVRGNKERVSESHREFFAGVTADEQAAIAKSHTKAMNSAIKTIQSI